MERRQAGEDQCVSKYQPIIEEKRVLVTVKAYPQPSKAYRETVCVAGVTDQGQFIRLFPVMFRDYDEGQRFKTYAWIRIKAWKTPSDSRPESYHIDPDSLQVESVLGTEHSWAERWRRLRPLITPSLEDLKARERLDGTSLGLIKPRELQRLVIEPEDEPEWSSRDRGKLLRRDLFDSGGVYRPLHLLEKIPLRFKYRFLCEDPACRGHESTIISWEVMESYRKYKQNYGDIWEQKFRERYWDDMLAKDLHFYMGNMAVHRTSWLIIGLYYPPKVAPDNSARPDAIQPRLFEI